MRHGKTINHLGRTNSHRNAMLQNMAVSLIINKRINTTVAKAKALRKFVEPILTRAKEDNMHNRRMAFSYLQDKEAIKELFGLISEKIGERPGGYTRIIKTGFRLGDAAEMCMIELVDFNEVLLSESKAKKAKTTRRGRAGAKKASAAPVIAEATAVESPAAETATEEAPKAE
ncbi:MAG: 50S ribosomal protein L17 [Bacteroidia bacterium]